jgi:membrane-bound metal-dependent hydrolase YbcI (DUF457 family)
MLTTLHFFTHIGLGWIIAGLGPGPRRDRWLIVLAGLVPDLDGIGILWSEQAYRATHRVIGHSLPFGLLLVAVVVLLADRRRVTGLLAAVSFQLHLLLDVVGTGGLPTRYLWPVSTWTWTYDGHWVLASWQNGVVMSLTLLGVVATAWWRRRRRPTPPASSRATFHGGGRAEGPPARSRPPS